MAAPCLDPRTDAFWHSRASVVFANPRDPASDGARHSALADGGPGGDGLVHFLTSGSSGRPKIVGFTRTALLASARAVNEFLDTTPRDVWLRVLPGFHVGGFQVGARAWAAGARCVDRDERWDPESLVHLCQAERVTLVSLVPTQVHDLVHRRLPSPASLRVVLVGGGELRPALWHQARELGWPVRTSYGLTEAASTVAAQAIDEPDCTRLTLLSHWSASTSGDGTLVLCGPSLPHTIASWDENAGGYRHVPVQPPLATRDRVLLDGRSLVFQGRADRVVKRLGELVDMAEVERALADAALAAGTFGRVQVQCEPDARDGHRLVLECLDPEEGATTAARFDAARPPFARFSEIRVVHAFRRSALGKPLARREGEPDDAG